MRYRIKEEGGYFTPQYTWLFKWRNIPGPHYRTIDGARHAIIDRKLEIATAKVRAYSLKEAKKVKYHAATKNPRN